MNLLGTGNSKLKATAKALNVRIFNFSIPAYKSQSGKITCPFAKDCVKYCYAQKGAYSWSNVQQALENRFSASKGDCFVADMVNEIKAKRQDKQIYIRIHDSGDFYSPTYLAKWIEIAQQLPNVRFYAYTKSHDLVRSADIPQNLDIIFSLGSKLDQKVNKETERFAEIFKDRAPVDYSNASKNDLLATKWFSTTNKVALMFH